jgi:hypothetical protein
MTKSGGATRLSWLQGLFYLAGGAWPLVSPGTFQRVTGPKVDFWLAQTVGLQLVIVGFLLVRAARRGSVSSDVALLGAATAIMFALVDLYCVTQPRTTYAYLGDAVIEVALAVAWWCVRRDVDRRRRGG